ncbi:biotin/lipoyl-binding protein [Sulfurimonas sp. SAG-AH-194-C21]|nr:biotin/lipoyl-binding protein [Sulfurimonas sp. SAG-AH-194-C21]MDF1883373.1 biotin/lipoyl-binding protein [Sulfurimonas sp. SAG-AH-194-C21]
MKDKLIYIVMAFVLALVVWVAFTFYMAYEPKQIVLQGEIDAQSYSISSKLPGRISEVFVKKGDYVEAGDTIFSISSPEVQAKLAQAKAALDAAGAQKKQANNGARKQQIQAASDQWQKAKAAESLMFTTYKRIQTLYDEGVVSEQKRDEVFTKYKAAKYTSNAAKQMAVMAKEGARYEVKDAADAQERVYAAKVDEVNAYIDETLAHSFHRGEVSQVLIHSGELAPTGFPVVSIIDIQDSWAKFAVREDYLKEFVKGKVFKAKIPALGNDVYELQVTNISVMGSFATWRATESGKGYDMKSFEVELRPLKAIQDLRVGMSVLLEL